MARGQVSEEDLSSGLKGLGGFGSLGGARVVKDSPFRDSRSAPKPADPPKVIEVPTIAKQASESPVVPDARLQPAKELVRREPVKKSPAASKAEPAGRRVADIYTERVTLQLSPEMRDRVDALAREIQRSKTDKGERITANTVMRVAIQHVLKHFKLTGGDVPNGEDALLAAIEKRCTWK